MINPSEKEIRRIAKVRVRQWSALERPAAKEARSILLAEAETAARVGSQGGSPSVAAQAAVTESRPRWREYLKKTWTRSSHIMGAHFFQSAKDKFKKGLSIRWTGLLTRISILPSCSIP